MIKEILHFTAEWCQPCKVAKPVIDKYIANNPDIVYTVIDIDKDKELMQKHITLNIMSVPSFVGVYDGVYNRGHAGVPTMADLDTLFGCGDAKVNCG